MKQEFLASRGFFALALLYWVVDMKDKSEFLYCVFIVAAAILSAVARCSFTRPDQLGRDSYD